MNSDISGSGRAAGCRNFHKCGCLTRLFRITCPLSLYCNHLPAMSSHSTSTSASAAAAANQALIALVTRLTEMVQDVNWLPSQEEKMELSRKIAREVVCFITCQLS